MNQQKRKPQVGIICSNGCIAIADSGTTALVGPTKDIKTIINSMGSLVQYKGIHINIHIYNNKNF